MRSEGESTGAAAPDPRRQGGGRPADGVEPESPYAREPRRRLAPASKTLWRLTAGLYLLPALLVASWGGSALRAVGAGGVLPWLPLVAAVLGVGLAVVVLPPLRYRRWRYEIRDDEIDIRHGALSIRRTLVPMTRVQHVETRSGPLQGAFDLATVVFHTAAGENLIPQLPEKEADDVRRRVASLARASTDEL